MKNFETPDIKVAIFSVEDIVTTSNPTIPKDNNPNALPWA